LRFHLGPLAIPGRTAGYADVRARRLAAARHPAELEAWWRHLDGGRDVPAVPWPEPAALAALAAALLSRPAEAQNTNVFELRDGDRVVL
ncbi:MAG TPA: hypothetical protein DD490_18245, partial [Acidobacteria bacterium]|nr:hypothetical protein [Acidobacteriota bacterium]